MPFLRSTKKRNLLQVSDVCDSGLLGTVCAQVIDNVLVSV
jgi:hypothetical protein